MLGTTPKRPWVDQAIEGEELERADEVAELLGKASDSDDSDDYFMAEEDLPSSTPTVGRISFLSQHPDSDLAVMQAEDPDLGPVTEWLRNAEIPTFDDLRSYSLATRKLWDLVPMVHLVNDVLVCKPHENADIKLVVPTALCKQLFDACHSGPLAAHLGSFRMAQELKLNYFWPGLRQDVQNWCKQCPICAKAEDHLLAGMVDCKRS